MSSHTDSLTFVDSTAKRQRLLPDLGEGKVWLNELYTSLQGESTFAGLACVFIRLTGCSLRCRYCDSSHAFHEGDEWTIEKIVKQSFSYQLPLIEVTGGEPLDQPGCLELLNELTDGPSQVLLETAGTVLLDKVPAAVIKILDIKTPSSGEELDWSKQLPFLNSGRDEIKAVISTWEDFDFILDLVQRYDLDQKYQVHISPVNAGRTLDLKVLAQKILDSKRALRLSTQLHRQVWGEERSR